MGNDRENYEVFLMDISNVCIFYRPQYQMNFSSIRHKKSLTFIVFFSWLFGMSAFCATATLVDLLSTNQRKAAAHPEVFPRILTNSFNNLIWAGVGFAVRVVEESKYCLAAPISISLQLFA
jgi:hypothetical protein